jgi:hypothetical protein
VATCTATYRTTDADASGSVSNVVSVEGTYGSTFTSTYTAVSPSVTVSSAVSCAVLGVSATPNPVSAFNGRLLSPVTINVPIAGTCSGLQVRYFPQGAAVIADLNPGPGAWSYVIPANGADSSLWSTGDRFVQVIDSSGTLLRAGTLTVNAA